MPRKPEGRLARLDLTASLSKEAYETRLSELRDRLRLIQQAYLFSGDSAVIVFEGWDAAGKGGAIRRLSSALDPRGFHVWPIGAPGERERSRHYLQRFWEKLPGRGAIAVFDRSWYGRVLVERVEGLTPEARWRAAYDEINAFERMLVADGIRLVKLFLHISREEQLRRFEARLQDPTKRWKLSYEDFRNRDRWDQYIAAAEEMFEHTDDAAPWTLVSSELKRWGRIASVETIVKALEAGADLAPPPLDPKMLQAAKEALDLEPAQLRKLGGRNM